MLGPFNPDGPSMPKKIEIFRPGSFRPMAGGRLDFSASDLQACADVYDPARWEAPLVVGHPPLDAPAYGWVEKIEFADDRLLATPRQVEPQFQALVNQGRYKRVSASFFTPRGSDNPVPGSLYLRHVGFLGAAAPAVAGLKSVSFRSSAECDGIVTVDFAIDEAWALSSIAGLFRRLREWVIARDGVAAADQVLSTYDIDTIATASVAVRAEEAAEAPASEGGVTSPIFASQPNPQEEARLAATEADLARREAELQQARAEIEARAAQFAAREAEHRRAGIVEFTSGLVTAGKVLPAERGAIEAVLFALDPAGTVEFAAADGKVATSTTEAALRGFLTGLPARVDFTERARADETVDFASDPAALADAARRLVADEAAKGVAITHDEAVMRLSTTL